MLEENQSGSMTARYVCGPFYVNQLVQQTTAAHGTQYVEQDANRNLTSLTNSSGAVVERYSYSSYGVRTVYNASGSALSGSAYATVYGSQGGRYNPTTGLILFGSRYLNTATGSWLQRDPTGSMYVNGANLYQFVGDSPIDRHDPSGADWKSFLGGLTDGVEQGFIAGAEIAVGVALAPELAAVAAVAGAVYAGVAIGEAIVGTNLSGTPLSDYQRGNLVGNVAGGFWGASFVGGGPLFGEGSDGGGDGEGDGEDEDECDQSEPTETAPEPEGEDPEALEPESDDDAPASNQPQANQPNAAENLPTRIGDFPPEYAKAANKAFNMTQDPAGAAALRDSIPPNIRTQLADFYERTAANVGGSNAAAARQLNLDRAAYLRGEGPPPGNLGIGGGRR